MIRHIKERIRLNRRTFILYSVLRALVIVTAIRCAIEGDYESLANCILALVLFLLPEFFAERLKVGIPALFESIIYLFIFAAEILGEVNRYYTTIPGWDTMLHTINGFLCAAIGFSLVEILSRNSSVSNLSPQYLAFTAFCFSMTVGVMWEFIEFAADHIFLLDMQKDRIVQQFSSVLLDPSQSQKVIRVSGITRTIIETSGDITYTIDGGYLDIGLIDTMKDLFVNFIGAVVFSVIGYYHVKDRESAHSKLAENLLLHTLTDAELAAQQQEIDRRAEELRDEFTSRIQRMTKH